MTEYSTEQAIIDLYEATLSKVQIDGSTIITSHASANNNC